MKNGILYALCFFVILAGCAHNTEPCANCSFWENARTKSKPLAVMIAKYTSTPIKIDGCLDEDAWKKANVYPMYLPEDASQSGKALEENGEVSLAWDDTYFYVGVKFYDSDIVAEGKEDQLMHFTMGDVCEVFLKNDNFTWYWELYGTPLGYKTNLFFPGWGRMGLPSMKDYKSGLKVAAQVNGTVNNWKDKDEYYTIELAMPIKDLTALGGTFGPGEPWRILVARYNYSRYLDRQGPELSASPLLSATNYHLIKEYARIYIEK
jgi:hypothetical protein